MATKFEQNGTQIIFGSCRLTYVFLNDPYAPQGTAKEDGKYQVTVLIPKSETALVAAIRAAIDAAVQKGKVEKWRQTVPHFKNQPLRDGDEREKDAEQYRGYWYLTAKSARRVPVYTLQGHPIMDPEQIYSGMYGAVDINFFPYASAGNNGIGIGLNGVQKTGDGERMSGGGGTSASAFMQMGFGENVGDDDL